MFMKKYDAKSSFYYDVSSFWKMLEFWGNKSLKGFKDRIVVYLLLEP